ncbi:hypothetical protein LTR62_005186 [Meristemomyces frigidus]|uniref:Uncharacterized protein n=1 Tax=Meristemomyces frigidus TaxID=1508187 RepID=A0AAN7TEZ0_9PEZI|nr:hypothetical protein LTR62_005186 [Meristemomyces frigidus]
MRSLYPVRRPSSVSSGVFHSHGGIPSSASSVSGFSLFQAPIGPVEDRPSQTLFGPPSPPSLNVTNPSTSSVHVTEDPGAEALMPNGYNLDVDRIQEACTELEGYISRTPAHFRYSSYFVMTDDQAKVASAETFLPDSLHSGQTPCSHRFEEHEMLSEMLLADPGPPGRKETTDLSAQEYARAVYTYWERYLVSAYESAYHATDYLAAQRKLQRLKEFHTIYANDSGHSRLIATLQTLHTSIDADVTDLDTAVQNCNAWMGLARPMLDTFHEEIKAQVQRMNSLRDQMWFVADVRTSGPYDEARAIAGALRIMGKARKPQRSREAPSLRHAGVAKPSTTSQLKIEAQILELLSALPEQGGPNKLSDDMSRGTAAWMNANHIENVCRGEERLHKMCMDIRKCVDHITAGEGTFLGNNPLFAREAGTLGSSSGATLQAPQVMKRYDQLTLRTNVTPSIESVSSFSNPLSSVSSREWLDSQSPTLTHKSSTPFWSPVMTEALSPSSITSIGTRGTHREPSSPKTKVRSTAPGISIVGSLRRTLTSLLLSDLCSGLFHDGSETDSAFWTGIGGELAEKHVQQVWHIHEDDTSPLRLPELPTSPPFDHRQVLRHMMQDFSAHTSPTKKLSILQAVDEMLPLFADKHMDKLSHATRANGRVAVQADGSINGFRKMFCDPELRPVAIFRDLQYIASLVPDVTVTSSPAGKAFCNAVVAACSIKRDLINIMIETADSIIAHNSNNRGHNQLDSPKQLLRDSTTFTAPSRTSSAEEVARYGMSGAAHLLQITAKENHPVAQRELATLYLTHPELLDHSLFPFTRPRDVFRLELEAKWKGKKDAMRCDPGTMCVASHWMGLSCAGGDALAAEALRQGEEMERLG